MDYRYTLPAVREAWENCTRCSLGQHRQEVGGKFVFGEGQPRGIMFIGEGPGGTEEEQGRPFVGRSGQVLRRVIHKLGIAHCSYITNVVACRACAQAYTSEGQPMTRYNRKLGRNLPVIRDEPPTPQQIVECLPRLYAEIYLADPILIVALGGEATKALITERSFSIMSARGNTREITIPGAWHLPAVTEKKGVWLRKAKGQYIMPTEQNRVRYLLLPTLHPSFVLRKQRDRSFNNPVHVFLEDMKLAARIYDRYQVENCGSEPGVYEVTEEDVMEDEGM